MIKYLKTKYVLFFLLALFVISIGVSWICFGIILFSLVYWGMMYFIAFIKIPFLQKFIKGFFLFLFIASIAISIKLFVCDIYKIPSSSMENTLFPNDIIIVDKLEYGPRLPRSPFDIPWINIAFYFNKKARDSIKVNWWGYKRWSGASKIKNGDVFVYENFSKNVFFVKRVVGISGDTLDIKKGHVYINKVKQEFVGTMRNRYRFKVNDKKSFYDKIDSLGINEIINRDINDSNFMQAELTNVELKKMKQIKCIDSLGLNLAVFNDKEVLFANPEGKHWTIDDLGTVIIPKKGMKVILNEENYTIYKTIINLYEGGDIEKSESLFLINGKLALSYVFKHDYFFMMGDNRKESFDSRFFGFLPKENIVGKVQCVLLSNYQDEFRWDRFLKKIE
ncbi:signal peptidase I [Mariniflexile litorale]|uniref:Signal peptidase I n=1 Tax=Mariniflexile litorale TaxID=3045158 RepID=A0AAU7EHI4_9FLAO|nr:signal peptidase I [Mariniflexile sp. KMM 9835]MDQ8209995.1 signal peptidase I [Mariniflexile sp. KMM 9835]